MYFFITIINLILFIITLLGIIIILINLNFLLKSPSLHYKTSYEFNEYIKKLEQSLYIQYIKTDKIFQIGNVIKIKFYNLPELHFTITELDKDTIKLENSLFFHNFTIIYKNQNNLQIIINGILKFILISYIKSKQSKILEID